MGSKRTEPSRDGLSADYSAPRIQTKAVTLLNHKVTNQSRGVEPIAASPNIIEDHTNGVRNGNRAEIQYRIVGRPGTPLTMALKP